MERSDNYVGAIGRGKGKFKERYGTQPRKPRDQMIEEGTVPPSEEKTIRSLSRSNSGSNSASQIVAGVEQMNLDGKVPSSVSNGSVEVLSPSLESNDSDGSVKLSSYEVLLRAVNNEEFVPRYQSVKQNVQPEFTEAEEYASWDDYGPGIDDSGDPIAINPAFLDITDASNDDQKTLDIFQNLIDEIVLSPFDEDLYTFASSLVAEWAQERQTVNAMARMIIERGIQDRSFSYPGGKLASVLSEIPAEYTASGAKFQVEFFTLANKSYIAAVNAIKQKPSEEAINRITGLAIFFGELLNSMEIQGKINKLLGKVVVDLMHLFLKEQTEPLISCLTKLLKLTGPIMDANKDYLGNNIVDNLFDSVQQFWAGADSKKLPTKLREDLLKIYKLHTRDWDRSPQASGQSYNTSLPDPEDLGPYANEESLNAFIDSRNMDQYGTPEELDEIDDAYEEFLKMSGQVG